MSHEAKATAGQAAKWTAIVTLLVILLTKAVGAGEILHEVKGLRGDLDQLKVLIQRNRDERIRDFKELVGEQNKLGEEHRKLERRVEILEFHGDPRTGRGMTK